MLRSVHPVPVPIGNYVRPTRRDHRLLLNMLGEGRLPTTGIVVDPVLWDAHEELGGEAGSHGLEVILDPLTLELSTPGGFSRTGLSGLPWAIDRPHDPPDLRGDAGRVLVERVLDFAEGKPFTAYLSPSHFLASVDSEWLDVDLALAWRLRDELDLRGRRDQLLYYPLVVHTDVIRNPGSRRRLIERLRNLDLDGLWLKVHPFGVTSAGRWGSAGTSRPAETFMLLGCPSWATGRAPWGWPSLLSAHWVRSKRVSP
jgi:hypothetical protein